MFGVCVSGFPPMHPTKSFMSSTMIIKTFGFLAATVLMSPQENETATTGKKKKATLAKNSRAMEKLPKEILCVLG